MSIKTTCTKTSERIETAQHFHISPVVPAGSRGYLFLKRTLDIVVSLAVLILAFVPMLFLSAAIKLDSRGPVLYKQERLGLDGKPFLIFKFRSMYTNAEQDGPQWANKIDYRCTRVGRFIRKSRLDELPQAWNILKGEMSLVGPRPERAYFYDQFETYIHGFRHRLIVKPGLTGLAQVNGGYELKPEEKIAYDMEYIEHRSVKLDLHCILKTVRLIFTHEGAR